MLEFLVRFSFDILAFVSVMVLIVLGLGIIASMMGIFNFAHGELVLLGAFTVFLANDVGLNIWWGILAAPLVVGLFGFLLERAIIKRFYASPIIAMLGTYAIGLVIREIVRGILGGQYRPVPEPWPGFYVVGGQEFSIWRSFIIVTTVAAIAGSWLFLSRTAFGLRIRGSLENPTLARACGISTQKLYSLTFAFGAALAGLPPIEGRRRILEISRPNGVFETHVWRGATIATAAFSLDSERLARAARLGGSLAIRVPAEGEQPSRLFQLDLPSDATGLDAALTACGVPLVADGDDIQPAYTRPEGAVQWREHPRPRYPQRAADRGIQEGRVVLSCVVTSEGRTRDCEVVSEVPTGADFGREALAAARRATLDVPVGRPSDSGRITFPISFRIE